MSDCLTILSFRRPKVSGSQGSNKARQRKFLVKRRFVNQIHEKQHKAKQNQENEKGRQMTSQMTAQPIFKSDDQG